MPSITTLFRRLLYVVLGAAIGLTLSATAASASPSSTAGNPNAACDGTHHSDTGHGANHRGAYDETCDGSPSRNGNAKGNATGKPCAGCVGNADDKNPKGQAPNGKDHNAGYECDRNHGVGRTNPAHTGCSPADTDSTSTGGGSESKPKPTHPPKPPKGPTPPADPGCPAGTMPTGDGGCVSAEVLVPPTLDPGSPARTFQVDPGNGVADPTEVLGVSFVRALSSEVGVLGGELGRSGEGELPLTGVTSAPDMTVIAFALMAVGMLVRRLGRRRTTT